MEILYSVLIVAIIYYSLRISYLFFNQKNFVLKKETLLFIITVYNVFFIKYITGIPNFFISDLNGRLNIVPFSSISILNASIHIVAFIFLGLSFSIYYKYKFDFSFYKVMLISISFSIAIEFIRIFTGKIVDIDNVIVNSIGMFIGFYLHHVIIANIVKIKKSV